MGLLSKITKPFKKILKSPIGKAALLLGLGHFGPKLLGAGSAGFGQWKNVPWKDLPWWKAGIVAGGAAGAAGGLEEEDETIVSEAGGTGHDDYLRMRQMFVENDPNVWTNKVPMFSRGSQGGRVGANIGLYAGQGGGMNKNMNPMMNQGLGAVGSRGMNPFNQQNLMQQAQMRGNPMMGQQRPPIPGGPTTAHGPGITGTQASAALAKKEEDTELLQLIKMLASMGIPMEQLRGRTKEELVEMVMSVSAKAKAQGGGEEVVEEQEEVVEAAHGGRIGFQGGGADQDGWSPGVSHSGAPPSTSSDRGPREDPDRFGPTTNINLSGGDRVPKGPVNYGQRYNPNLSFGSNIGKDLSGADLAALFTNYYQIPTEDKTNPNTWDYQPPQDGAIDLGFAAKPEAAVALDKVYGSGLDSRTQTYEDILAGNYNRGGRVPAAGGLTRTRYAMGTEQPIIPSRDGPQIDYRNIGGYQPHGAKEKKDDVRALLAQGEFVVTSDAVKGIGEGDRELGAKRMYNMMHKYEPIGRALS